MVWSITVDSAVCKEGVEVLKPSVYSAAVLITECILIQSNFRILKTLCAFFGDNKTHI
jgi:hypothetical protein